jgi:hypothetical protein
LEAFERIVDVDARLRGVLGTDPHAVVEIVASGTQRTLQRDRRVGQFDTMGRDGRRRQLAIWPRSQAPEIRRGLATAVMEGIDLAAGGCGRNYTAGVTPTVHSLDLRSAIRKDGDAVLQPADLGSTDGGVCGDGS